jgi:hypothetical protein
VADAGANTIDEVRPDGSVRILAYLPNPTAPNGSPIGDATPTCLAKGKDGMIYVGTLAFVKSLFVFHQPAAMVYRFNPNASTSIQFLGDADIWASGFNPIVGCGFADDGFFVTEFTNQLNFGPGFLAGGDVVRVAVNHDGSAGARTVYGTGVLNNPNGFVAGRGDYIYVSNNSTSANGQVVRIRVDNGDEDRGPGHGRH